MKYFYWLKLTFSFLLFTTVILLILTVFNPFKKFQFLKVLSGSMEPTIKVGSIILIKQIEPEKIAKGAIITFTPLNNPNLLITHRVVEITKKNNQIIFKTKGDANPTDDLNEITSNQIKGRVVFSLPWLGYLSVWLKTPLGFISLVVIPAFFLILNELIQLKKSIEEEIIKKYGKKSD